MAIALRFNGEQFYMDLRDQLVQTMDKLNSDLYREATSGLSSEARADTEKESAHVESTTDYDGTVGHTGAQEEYINARCRYYANAIIESFGTGQLADTSTPSGKLAWENYKKSEFWNPARGTGKWSEKVIQGRPAGSYTNLWGEEKTSSGANKGKNLEGLHIVGRNGEVSQVKPQPPSYSIQNAEVWIMQDDRETKMERAIETSVIQFINEMQSNPMKYFYYVEI